MHSSILVAGRASRKYWCHLLFEPPQSHVTLRESPSLCRETQTRPTPILWGLSRTQGKVRSVSLVPHTKKSYILINIKKNKTWSASRIFCNSFCIETISSLNVVRKFMQTIRSSKWSIPAKLWINLRTRQQASSNCQELHVPFSQLTFLAYLKVAFPLLIFSGYPNVFVSLSFLLS